MINDALATNIFKNIKEPALILSVKSEEAIVKAVNQAYTDLTGITAQKLVGLDLYSVIFSESSRDLTILKASINRLGESSDQEDILLQNYLGEDSQKIVDHGPIEVHNVLLSSCKESGNYVLHTVNFEPVQALHKDSPSPAIAQAGPSNNANSPILEAVYLGAEEPFVLLDNNLCITFCNKRFHELYFAYYGVTIEMGKSIIDYAKEERRPLLEERYSRVLDGNREQSEFITVVSGNVIKKLMLDYKPIIGGSGLVESIFVSAKDITLQRETEHKLEENERELGLIYDHLPDPIFVVGVSPGPIFSFISVNNAFLELAGMSANLVLGAPIDHVIPDAYLQKTIDYYCNCITQGISLSKEEKIVEASGERTIVTTITPMLDKFGTCEKLIGSIHDITNRKKLEKIADTTNRKLSKILEFSPDLICTLDEFGRFLSANGALQRILGYNASCIEGKHLSDFMDKAGKKALTKILSQIISGKEINHFENRMRHIDGNMIPLVWSARWDEEERIIYGVGKDATEKQFAENQLKISEQRFKTLVQDGSDLIAILDPAGNYLYVSPTSQSVLGTLPEQYLGKNTFDFIHPSDKDSVMKDFEKLKSNHKVDFAPFRFLHHDGTWRWIESVLTDLTNDPAVNGIVANSRDITQKINTQKDILLSNERYRFATMATSDAIWDWDLETNKIYWGDGFQRLFHWETNQLCSDITAWAKLVHPEDLERVEKKLYAVLEGSENQWSDEYRFAKSDHGFAVVADRAFVVRDDKGKAIRVVGALQNVTKLRKNEQQVKLLESVVTQTSDLVIITKVNPVNPEERKIIYVNEAVCCLTGYSTSELIGKTSEVFHGPDTNRKELEKLSKAIKKWASCDVSIINYKKNGEEFWNNFSVNPLADERGSYTHWISIGRDITQTVNLQKQEGMMSAVSRIFNKTESLIEALEKTTRLLTKSEQYVYAEIWMLDHDGLRLSMMSNYSLCAEHELMYRDASLLTRVKKSQGFSGEVWKAGKIQSRTVSENRQKDLTEQQATNHSGMLFGLPLFYNNNFIGVLVLGSQDEEVQFEIGVLSERFGRHLGAEIRRKQLEQELGQIFDFAPDIIALSDFDGYLKKLNPAASAILGFTTQELMSKPFTEFLHPEDKEIAIERIHSQPIGNSNFLTEERYLTKTGKVKWLAWTSQAMWDSGLVFSVGKDITDKKNLEELLGRSNSLAKVGSWEINVLEGTVYWSDVTKEIREVDLNFEPDLNTGIENFRKDADKVIIRKKVEECISNGLPWDEELEILTFKNNPKWVRTIGQAEMVDGRCVRIFGSFQDIDVRKRAEIEAELALKELEESEKRYSDLFHLNPNPMLVYNNYTFQFIDVNEAALSHYGYSYEEFMCMTMKDIRPETEVSAFEEAVKKIRKKNCLFFQGVFKHQKKNGEIIDVEIKSNIINFKGKEARVSLINDVTERLKYFAALEKQNKILKEISWVQSHVVRAPLAKLMGLVALLSKQSMQDGMKQQQLIENIDICTAELDEIIREITKKSEQQEKLSRG